jgi:hypothetical protein
MNMMIRGRTATPGMRQGVRNGRLDTLAARFIKTDLHKRLTRQALEMYGQLHTVLPGDSRKLFPDYDDLLTAVERAGHLYFYRQGLNDGLRRRRRRR